MQPESKRPLSVILSGTLIRLASRMVPAAQRSDWTREWLAEIWHQWQFLHYAGSWDSREGLRLFIRSLGALVDAGWHLTSQDFVQHRLREWVRSPWTCLATWSGAIALIAILSAGLPATRDLFHLSPRVSSGRLLFIWLHPMAGGGDKGVPAEVAPAWSSHSHLLEGAAAFKLRHEMVRESSAGSFPMLTVSTDPSLFSVLRAVPALGAFPSDSGVVLTYSLWQSLFHGDHGILTSTVKIGGTSYPIRAVLDRRFRFLSRQPALYVVRPNTPDALSMIVARARPGVGLSKLDPELTRIAEVSCYDFFRGELRYAFLDEAIWIPAQIFAISVAVSALLLFIVSRVRLRHVRAALNHPNRRALIRRVGFWVGKTSLALAFVFVAGLEWTRSDSAILFGSQDPANGPFLLWLYVLGAMAVLFWSVADQQARCRVCLRLLCFPVRIGCPGCLLLDWSGTELLCTEGHGVLHVPHMASSWEEEHGRWIALDDSWKELFAGNRRGA